MSVSKALRYITVFVIFSLLSGCDGVMGKRLSLYHMDKSLIVEPDEGLATPPFVEGDLDQLDSQQPNKSKHQKSHQKNSKKSNK